MIKNTFNRESITRKALPLFLTAGLLGGCAINSSASSREFGTCGSVAAYGDAQTNEPVTLEPEQLVDQVRQDLGFLKEYLEKSGGDSLKIDYEGFGPLKIEMSSSSMSLLTASYNDGGYDKLNFELTEEGQIGEINYGTVACTVDGAIQPTRAVEFISVLRQTVETPEGER